MTLPHLDEQWDRALAIVAHPDDMEYGSASAVARWTAQGKEIAYLLVSKGEAGIQTMDPVEVGPLRVDEQIASCAVVGVSDVQFLDYPDGLITESVALRADLARSIRANRPEVILSINHRDDWGPGSWNHPDHRAVGRSILDAVRDAGNPWLFQGVGGEDGSGGEAWNGVRFVAFGGSVAPTHGVDIGETLDAGIASLECHRVYLDHLEGPMRDVPTFLSAAAEAAGTKLGVDEAVLFEVIGF